MIHNANRINMKIGNSKIIHRSLRKSNGNNFSLVSTRIQNRKKAFDIQYKLLHFSQRSFIHLREIGQNNGSIECVRCNRADETQKHWLFSCCSSQNMFIYLFYLLNYIDITQVIDNAVEDCLLYYLLEYDK